MFNFDFYNPTKIVFGKDRLNELDNYIPTNSKVLITYGGGSVKKFGTLKRITNILDTNGRNLFEFGGIEVNPRYDTLIKAVELIINEGIDYILAVGGGSVIDGSKFISLAAKYNGNSEQDLLHHGFNTVPVDEALPLGTVLTLPATGSEMNAGAVISHKDGKYQVVSPLAYPKFSFLDPTLTFTLPKEQVANGIADAFVHTIEQYLTYPANAKFQDKTAEGILTTLIEIAQIAMNEPENYNIRAELVWNSTMALNGLIGAGVPQDWSTHMIGHELTAHFGIDHAPSLSIILPALLEERKDKKKEKLLQYAKNVWNITNGDDDFKINIAIEKTQNFFSSLGLPIRLSEYKIDKSEIEKVITGLKNKGMLKLSETGDLTLGISRKILLKAY